MKRIFTFLLAMTLILSSFVMVRQKLLKNKSRTLRLQQQSLCTNRTLKPMNFRQPGNQAILHSLPFLWVRILPVISTLRQAAGRLTILQHEVLHGNMLMESQHQLYNLSLKPLLKGFYSAKLIDI